MSLVLRIVLIVVAVLSCIFVLRKIRKSQMRIEDTLFWLVISFGILVLGIFPQIAYWLSDVIGIMSPVNFVFLVFVFLLLFKVFILTVQVSQQQEKLKTLAQNVAIYESQLIKKEEKDTEENV